MLILARHIFMSILGAEDEVETIQLQGPGVGDVVPKRKIWVLLVQEG